MRQRFCFYFFLFITHYSLLITQYSLSQVELVDVRNPVYSFLKRMQLMNIIPGYNSSVTPVSRGEVGNYLTVIKYNKGKITLTDKKLLEEYETEFEYDMSGNTKNQINIFSKEGINNFSSFKKQKHLYLYTDSTKTFFGDFIGSLSQRGSGGDSLKDNSILLGEFGFTLRGTFYNSVGYFLGLSNGRFANANDRDIIFAADTDPLLKGNDNFIVDKKNFNSYEGYLRYQTKGNWLALTFGKTQLNQGFGYIDKLFLSNNTVPFSFGNLNIKYKAVNYSFTYGSIDGDSVGVYPYYTAMPLSSKNIATHKLNVNFGNAVKFGLWESVIISNEPFSFTFLNPISFLISADLNTGKEQTLQNNSLLGIELEVVPVKSLSVQSTLLIDDLTFGTLGKNDLYNENKFGWQLGTLWSNSLNMNIAIEFTHLDPFVYSHRSNKSTYTNHLMSLGHALPPNSDEIAGRISYDIGYILKFVFQYQHQRSGEGIIVDSAGKLIANYGGNINFGLGDQELRTNHFLDGTRINRDIFTADITWQFLKQFYLNVKYQYRIIDNITNNINFNDSYYFATFDVDL